MSNLMWLGKRIYVFGFLGENLNWPANKMLTKLRIIIKIITVVVFGIRVFFFSKTSSGICYRKVKCYFENIMITASNEKLDFSGMK